MLRKEDLNTIVDLIQKLVPKFELTPFKIEEFKVELGKTTKINAINIHIGTIGSEKEPLAIVTPIQSGGEIEKSIALLPTKNIAEPKKPPKIDIQKIPFNSGFHLIINQKDWWFKEGNKDKSVEIKYIKLIPIHKRSWSYVKTFEEQNQFGLQINDEGKLYVQIWADNTDELLTNLPLERKPFRFKEYLSSDIIKFENYPEILISLDKDIVEKAIMLEYTPDNSPLEYFVFILAKE